MPETAPKEIPIAVAHVVEGGPVMRTAIVRAATMLSPGLGRFEVVTVRDDPELTPALEEHGIRHFSLGAKTSKDYPAAVWPLTRWIRGEQISVVHGVEPIPGAIAGLAGSPPSRRLPLGHRSSRAESEASLRSSHPSAAC